ncbi:unnamed protein product [Anisakis simplex]|uniref:Laminin N-terminal domain-containing protein n=1 Tax=Anisakis simplex TaxID=6269 RepID=A0A0M3JYA0_ANISI|nr:unnamed protein product [Anisakis simplex]
MKVLFVLLINLIHSQTFAATPSMSSYSMECERGYRVSAIYRHTSSYQKSGALTIYCDLIEKDTSLVQCERLPSAPQCSGAPEGCMGATWLAGFHAYMVEESTEATLFEPICCGSSNVLVNEESCIHDRLNQALQPYEHAIARDLIYRGLQCWHQYNQNNTLVDIIWKLEICAFETSTSLANLLSSQFKILPQFSRSWFPS